MQQINYWPISPAHTKYSRYFSKRSFEIFFLYSQKREFDISYKLFPFPENMIWHFMQIVSTRASSHEMSKPIFWKKYLPSVLSVYNFIWTDRCTLPNVNSPVFGSTEWMEHVTTSPEGSVTEMVNGRPAVTPLTSVIVAPLPAGRLLK